MANSSITLGSFGGAQWRTNSVSYASTVTINGANFEHVTIGALTGNLTLEITGTPQNNKSLDVYIQQDATGSRTVTLGTSITMPADIASLPYATTANQGTLIKFQYVTAKSKWYVISCLPGIV